MLTTLLIAALSFCGAMAQKPSMPGGFNLGLVKEQIGEIMIVCGENPTSCECGNGRTLKGELFFPAIFGCNPKSCICPNGLTVNDLESIEPDTSLTREKFMTMMSLGNFMKHWSEIGETYESLCEGSAPTSCSCLNGGEITKYTKNPKLITCRPQVCECSDGSSIEVPDTLKYSFLHQMKDMCEVEDCKCTKSSMSIVPPFESVVQIEECAPQSCSCKDGATKDLPQLPQLEDNLIESFEGFQSKMFRRFLNLCNGELPSSCDCKKRSEPLTAFGDREEMKKCYPTKCTCRDGSVKDAPTKRGSYGQIIKDLEGKVGKEQIEKMTTFYRGEYSSFIPGAASFGGRPGGFPGGKPGGFPGGKPGGFPGGKPGGFPGGRPPFGSGPIPDFVKQLQG